MTHFHDGLRLTHMAKGDVPVWIAFYREKKDQFTNYRFDVILKNQNAENIKDPEWLFKDAIYLSAKKIDAVFEDEQNIYVAEVKQRLKSQSIGQVLSYRMLYENLFMPEKKVIPCLIGSVIDQDVYDLSELQEIKIYLVNTNKLTGI